MEKADEKFYQQILDIINSENKYNVPKEMIHQIEDTDFTVEQSEVVSPWLLNFALENRDKIKDEDHQYEVWSAIRTGSSMLCPDQVECLFPLLEAGHQIDTSLVTIKMIGRIFEAQPPSKVGEYENIAEKVYDFLNPMLDRYLVVLSSRDGATATLCATALVAMGSEKIYPILEKVKNKEGWFREYVLHNTEELRTAWQKRKDPISLQMDKFINETIDFLRRNNND